MDILHVSKSSMTDKKPDSGSSLPAGGIAGDVLTKVDGVDGNVVWVAPAVPIIPDPSATIPAGYSFFVGSNVSRNLISLPLADAGLYRLNLYLANSTFGKVQVKLTYNMLYNSPNPFHVVVATALWDATGGVNNEPVCVPFLFYHQSAGGGISLDAFVSNDAFGGAMNNYTAIGVVELVSNF